MDKGPHTLTGSQTGYVIVMGVKKTAPLLEFVFIVLVLLVLILR